MAPVGSASCRSAACGLELRVTSGCVTCAFLNRDRCNRDDRGGLERKTGNLTRLRPQPSAGYR